MVFECRFISRFVGRRHCRHLVIVVYFIKWVDIKHEVRLIIVLCWNIVLRLHENVTIEGVLSDIIDHLVQLATLELIERLGGQVGFFSFCRFDICIETLRADPFGGDALPGDHF